MIPNVVRGERMAGLMTYLVGPGRANEHTEPHLVAGDPAMLAWHDDAELSRDSALAIARHLDRPHTALEVDVKGGHVWHCSLSLRADEGVQTDEKWQAIANDFVRAMEFDDPDSPKAPCRWVAVRHGLSKNGNDHVHIVVDLVREDGTKASIHNDHHRAQKVSRALEVKHGLEPLESAKAERATRGYKPAEREAQATARARAKYERARKNDHHQQRPTWDHLEAEDRRARIAAELRTDQPRYLLAVKVRGCAAAAGDEAEFVRRMRRSGLLVRPRFADGRTDVVTGYSVAERPTAGERPIWYGGGHLGKDLRLPRLREAWPDTPTGASEAVDEWTAAKRGRRVVAPGREATEPDPAQWEQRNRELGELVEKLRTIPLEDRDTWATVARQTAGAFAAWSNATEEKPGDLAAAAEALSRSAQTYKSTPPPQKIGTSALSGSAMLLAAAARGGRGTVGQAVMIRQLLRLTQSIYEASKAAEQHRQAQLLANETRARLVRVREALPAPATAARPAGGTATLEQPTTLDPEAQAMLDRLRAGNAHDATAAVDPLPRPIEPRKTRQPNQPGPERGAER